MAAKDGRNATQAYRVRVGDVWHWVDPAAPRTAIEPGDTVVVYPAAGEAYVAILIGGLEPPSGEARNAAPGPVVFSTLEGEHFEVPADEIAALHLATIDDGQ